MQNKGLLLASLILLSATACTKQAYVAQPIDTASTQEKLTKKNTQSTDFNAFMLDRGYAETVLPIQQWSLDELTLSAIYHHPTINVAKEQLALAELKAKQAGLKPGIRIGGTLARSNQKNGDIRPWAYGLALNIPIITNNKQDIAIEKAQYDVEIARLSVATTAWQLRANLAQDLIDLNEALTKIDTYEQIDSTHTKHVAQYEKLLKHGVASSVSVSKAKLAQQKHATLLAQAKTTIKPLLKQIAVHAGVPYQDIKISELTLNYPDKLLNKKEINRDNYQQNMLTNRLDIRKGLVQYAIAESGLKMEIAKQTPDVTLSPGVIFEFGDTVWSLGIDTLLSSLKRNDLLIARAKQIRQVEAANVEALQAQRIGELVTSYANYEEQKAQYQLQRSTVAAEKAYYEKLEKQFNAGLIDRLALIQAQLNVDTSLIALNKIKFSYIKTILALENLLQTSFVDANS